MLICEPYLSRLPLEWCPLPHGASAKGPDFLSSPAPLARAQELKAALRARGVNFEGCLEKEELANLYRQQYPTHHQPRPKPSDSPPARKHAPSAPAGVSAVAEVSCFGSTMALRSGWEGVPDIPRSIQLDPSVPRVLRPNRESKARGKP